VELFWQEIYKVCNFKKIQILVDIFHSIFHENPSNFAYDFFKIVNFEKRC